MRDNHAQASWERGARKRAQGVSRANAVSHMKRNFLFDKARAATERGWDEMDAFIKARREKLTKTP